MYTKTAFLETFLNFPEISRVTYTRPIAIKNENNRFSRNTVAAINDDPINSSSGSSDGRRKALAAGEVYLPLRHDHPPFPPPHPPHADTERGGGSVHHPVTPHKHTPLSLRSQRPGRAPLHERQNRVSSMTALRFARAGKHRFKVYNYAPTTAYTPLYQRSPKSISRQRTGNPGKKHERPDLTFRGPFYRTRHVKLHDTIVPTRR